MKSLADVELKNIVVGGLAGTVFDMVIAIPLDAAGLYHAIDFRDADDVYIWGIGTGDVLTAAVGGIMALAGEQIKNEDLKEAGLGWLLSIGLFKLGELGGYIWYKWAGWGGVPEGARIAGARVHPILAPKFTPGVLKPKYQLGNPMTMAEKAARASGTYPGTYIPSRPGEAAVVGYRPATRAVPVREEVGPYAGGITAPKFIPGPLRPKYSHGA